MRLLITGSKGFIGTNLINYLNEKNMNFIEASSEDGDITDNKYFDKFSELKFSHCIHLAGKVFVPDSWNNPYEFYKSNLIGTLNTLEFCRKNDIHLIFLSTYVYGNSKSIPINEDNEIIATNPYSNSKILSENLCKYYFENFNVKVTVLRPFNIYGINQSEKFIIPHILKQALHYDSIEVLNLNTKRDFVYIDDLINAIILSIYNERRFSIYNVGSGKSYSIKEIIDTIQDILDSKKKIKEKGIFRKNEIDNIISDCSKIQNELGWSPKITFRNGLKKIIDNYKY